MREIPDYFWEWTEIEWETGARVLKPGAPEDVHAKLLEYERQGFSLTYRRCIINFDLESGQIIPTDEAIIRYRQFENEKKNSTKTA